MRYSVLALAPFVAAAYAQETTPATTSEPSSTTPVSIPPYSNTMTNFISETNSLGVVTGMPGFSNGYAPVAETAEPAVATIPAGLASGSVYTLAYGNASSFTVSVGSSTTYVLGAAATGISVAEGTASGSGSGSQSGQSGTATSGTATGTGREASATPSSAASANIKAASSAVLGLGALMAFVL